MSTLQLPRERKETLQYKEEEKASSSPGFHDRLDGLVAMRMLMMPQGVPGVGFFRADVSDSVPCCHIPLLFTN